MWATVSVCQRRVDGGAVVITFLSFLPRVLTNCQSGTPRRRLSHPVARWVDDVTGFAKNKSMKRQQTNPVLWLLWTSQTNGKLANFYSSRYLNIHSKKPSKWASSKLAIMYLGQPENGAREAPPSAAERMHILG